MKYLLAKSYDRKAHPNAPPAYALLTQHTRDVAAACEALAKAVGHVALANAELDESDFERFRLALLANGWTQDLGKASSHYQEMVSHVPEIQQLLRHETISALLVWQDARFRQWLTPLSHVLTLSVWGAAGHHRKFDLRTVPKQSPVLTVHIKHEDFAAILKEMGEHLGLDAPPPLETDLTIAYDGRESSDIAAVESLRDLFDEFEDCEAQFSDTHERRLLALVKGFGIAADVAASAVAARKQSASDYSLAKFVADSVTSVSLQTTDLTKLISRWAWERSEIEHLSHSDDSLPPDFIVRGFQNQVAESTSHLTLAQAGCGSGKSLAAYMWAREWCARVAAEGRTNFRLFFCLPTTGTTTEHFKDYALESGIDDVSLTHSRSSVDLQMMAETSAQEEADDEDTGNPARAALNAAQDKIESLALWSTPLIVTTADTVLGLMSNARKAVYSLPAIMSSAIVFDEIHAFDERMFGHLLVFLKNFPRLPVLLMTASLPDERLAALKSVFPDLEPIAGPVEFETLERYRLESYPTGGDMWCAVDECVARGEKVLWVRNRVEWANEVYRQCRERYADKLSRDAINVYHSRLRYKDRALRHRRVIDRFKQPTVPELKVPAILVATQVAEMSLDLSADLLVTDLAPVPSLIQRMGRLNRRATPDKPQDPKPALICALPPDEPKVEMPYEKHEMELAARWLGFLQECKPTASQRDLSEAFSKLNEADEFDIARAEKEAVFFSGLWRTRPALTRDEGYTVSVVLEADLAKCTERDRQGKPTADWMRRYEVAIPIKDEVMKWERVGTVRVAPTDRVAYDYDEATGEGTGAKWRN
ncbi:MAG: CRISPR-associated helicase Cas3' [Pyrinomonadaceae bacterium MAG19_C2-C3]|nr:CRISPR-associated helicase Cas3' [Pyrinomonadaceae bacterium MAG19_C2-C3]